MASSSKKQKGKSSGRAVGRVHLGRRVRRTKAGPAPTAIATQDQAAQVEVDRPLAAYDQLVKAAIERDNPDEMLHLLQASSRFREHVSYGAAEIAAVLHQRWERYGLGTPFFQYIEGALGLRADTVRRYIAVWELITSLEEPISRWLKQRPIGEVIRVAQHIRRYGDLDDEQMMALATAGSREELSSLLADYSSRPAKPSRRIAYQVAADGTLQAKKGGEVVDLGFIRNQDEDLLDPIRQEAYYRLVELLGAKQGV